MPSELSSFDRLDYCPNLKRELRSCQAAIIVSYLETYFPRPQDAQGRPSSAPVTLLLDRISRDLQISRRTLLVTLSILATWWGTEAERSAAARTGREFLNPAHSLHGKLKPYSLTGRKRAQWGVTWHLRRNWPVLNRLLNLSHGQQSQQDEPHSPTPGNIQPQHEVNACATPQTVSMQPFEKVLLSKSVIGQDRRSTRYTRNKASKELD
jgi:hypothetical protein